MKRFQLMQKVNAEGLYGCVQACLPYFENNGWKGRIVVVCPPIYERFFRGKTAYAMGKVGMSVLVKGLVCTNLQPLLFPQSVSPYGSGSNHASHLQITFPVVFPERPLISCSWQAMDFRREGKTGMAVTGIWPASVSPSIPSLSSAPCHSLS